MAEQDIMPFDAPEGGHVVMHAFPVTASQSFLPGEPVAVASGRILEASDEPDDVLTELWGIAADSSLDEDGNAKAADTLVSVYRITGHERFQTRNYSTDGTGSAGTITGAIVGTRAGLLFNNGSWWLDSHANTNKIATVEAVYNNDGEQVFGSTTGTVVVFRFTLVHATEAGAA